MSKYAQQQEYRVKKILEKIPGVTVVKYFGSREKNKGDLLVKVGSESSSLLRIDHKSTRNPEKIVIEKDWMPTLNKYCYLCHHAEGESIPIITLSLLNHRQIYAVSCLCIGQHTCVTGTASNRIHLNVNTLSSIGKDTILMGITPDYLPVWIYRLETFIERYRLNY